MLGAAVDPRGCGSTDLAQVSSTDQTGLRHLRAYLVRIVPNRSRTFANGCEAMGGYVGSRFAGAGTDQLDVARYVKLADSLPTALLCVQVAYANPTGRIVPHEVSRRECAHVTQPRPPGCHRERYPRADNGELVVVDGDRGEVTPAKHG